MKNFLLHIGHTKTGSAAPKENGKILKSSLGSLPLQLEEERRWEPADWGRARLRSFCNENPRLVSFVQRSLGKKMPSIEFRIPISPLPGFAHEILLIALSLQRLGPPYDTARILVTVGDNFDAEEMYTLYPWSRNFPIVWRSLVQLDFNRFSYAATGLERYLVPAETDVVCMLDADTVPINRFDKLLRDVCRGETVAGRTAHMPPPSHPEKQNVSFDWGPVLIYFGLGAESLRYHYSSPQYSGHSCPPYLNHGFVCYSRQALENYGESIVEASLFLKEEAKIFSFDPVFCSQVAIALAIVKAGIRFHEMTRHEHAANHPNMDLATVGFHLDAVRLVHYINEEEFFRLEFLKNRSALQSFLKKKMNNPINRLVQGHVGRFAHKMLTCMNA